MACSPYTSLCAFIFRSSSVLCACSVSFLVLHRAAWHVTQAPLDDAGVTSAALPCIRRGSFPREAAPTSPEMCPYPSLQGISSPLHRSLGTARAWPDAPESRCLLRQLPRGLRAYPKHGSCACWCNYILQVSIPETMASECN